MPGMPSRPRVRRSVSEERARRQRL